MTIPNYHCKPDSTITFGSHSIIEQLKDDIIMLQERLKDRTRAYEEKDRKQIERQEYITRVDPYG